MMAITAYVPTLNSAATLQRCIQSLKEQVYPIKAIFVIDGGSHDSTSAIAKAARVRLIRQDGRGLAAARNTALKHCRTEWILSVDSDCRLEKGWLAKAVRAIEEPDASGVCGSLIEDNTERLADRWRANHLRQDWGEKRMINPDFLFGADSLLRAGDIRDAGGYDERFMTNYEDVDLSRRLMGLGKRLLYLPDAKAYHMKADSIASVIQAARRFSFYSYTLPHNLLGLAARLAIYNNYAFLRHIWIDIIKGDIPAAIVTMASLTYSDYYDMRYYLGRRDQAGHQYLFI